MVCTCINRLNPLLGYTKADLVGNVPFHLHHHDDEEATMQCSVGGKTCYVAILYYTYGSTYSRNGPNVPYMQYKMFAFIKLQ